MFMIDRQPNLQFCTMRTGILLILIVWSQVLLQSQSNRSFENLTTSDGLSHISVRCMLQDSRGFLWIGTNDGLNRYDGYRFKVLFPQGPDRKVHSFITALHEDQEGKIWVGTLEGYVFRLDPTTGQFEHFTNDPEQQKPLFKGEIWYFFEDRQGDLWIRVLGSFLWLNRATGDVRYFKHDPEIPRSLSSFRLTKIFEDQRSNIWIGTANKGLNRFDRTTGDFDRFYANPADARSLSGNFVTDIHEDEANRLWISTNNGLNLVRMGPDSTSFQFEHYTGQPGNSTSHLGKMVTEIINGPEGKLWVGTWDQGINLLDPSNGNMQRFPRPTGLPDNTRYRLFEDRRGALWLRWNHGLVRLDQDNSRYESFISGGKTGFPDQTDIEGLFEDLQGNFWIWGITGEQRGIFRLNPYAKPFTNISGRSQNIDEETTEKVIVWALEKDDRGNIWVGTEKGLALLNRRAGQPLFFSFENDFSKALSGHQVRALLREGPDSLWVGTFDDGLYLLDFKTQKLEHFLPNSEGLDGFAARNTVQICRDHKGQLWIGSFGGGLNLLDRETGQFQRFTHDPNDPNSLSGQFVLAIYEDRSNNLWIGTDQGLDRLDPDNRSFKKFAPDSNTAEPRSIRGVRHIYEDGKGNLWFGTDQGLYCWDPLSRRMDHYSEEDGLLDHTIQAMMEDDLGRLWMSTDKGISRFDPERKIFLNYDARDGLPLTFAWHAKLKDDQTGRLYFGSIDGITAFEAEQILDNPYVPPIVLSRFVRHNAQEENSGAITNHFFVENEPINLTYRDKVLEFEFAALNYEQAWKNRYAYRLENTRGQWIPLGNNPKITFTNLNPGEHLLQVKGSNNDGVWNDDGISLQIQIRPPWWKTKVAYVLYGLSSLMALWLIYRWRTQAQRGKLIRTRQLNDRLQQIDQLKDQFLANTSHELRTPLHGMIGLAESLLEKSGNTEDQENLGMLIASGKRLSSLVNDLLDFSKVKNHDLQLAQKPIGLRPLVDVVLRACSPLANYKTIELNNDIPGNLPAVYADEDRLQQILYNLIGNAIKFTERGHISISAVDDEDMIRISVKDTGIGIPVDQQEVIFQSFEQGDGSSTRQYGGTGLGLAISRQLVTLHGGQIGVHSEVGKGSTFFFTLPAIAQAASDLKTKASPSTSSNSFVGLPTAPPSVNPAISLTTSAEDQVCILLVDDEPVNHQVIKNYLKADHIQLTSAMSGQQALEIVRKAPPFDLILLDIMMPHMTGYEVCQKIRERYLPSEMPVIMVTAKGQVSDLIQGLDTGANDYITKPFSKDEFLARIKTHLNLHRIHTAANRFVPLDFIKAIGRDTITEIRRGDQKERHVTVLFTDIRSYTALSETMTPEENFQFVNAYAERMGPIIRNHGGFVNQYLGDGIMAIFQNRPEDALRAAIAMQKELQQYNKTRIARERQPLRVGMGIHTGPLIMGIIGDAKRNDAATISDSVNTASRIEGLTKSYEVNILISSDCLEQITDKADFNIRFLGKVLVKGKKESIGIYECFDGDIPEQLQHKLDTAIDFKSGMEKFFSREFPQSATIFNQILKINDADQTARLFLKKASQYTIDGVPEGWTGVEVATFK